MLFKKTKAGPAAGQKGAETSPNRGKMGNDADKMHIFNLIILDESGSMSSVERAAREGCNEVLSSIRRAQGRHAGENVQHVSIVPFSDRAHYAVRNEEIDRVHDLTSADYSPNGCTALYDAMGMSLHDLEEAVERYDDAVAVVTVITDGYENASRKFTGGHIRELIGKLKKKGWTFAFMGANVDVESEAGKLNIDNAHKFEATEIGVSIAFEAQVSAQESYVERMNTHRAKTASMSREQRQKYYSDAEQGVDFYAEGAKHHGKHKHHS